MARPAKGSDLFDLEQHGNTMVVIPTIDMREFEYQCIEDGARQVLNLLENGQIKNIVIDFNKTDYYGSTALGLFLKFWKRITSRGGRMAFCNISDTERKILAIARLHRLWPICASRQEALEQVIAGDDDSAGKSDPDKDR
jgi:stage II sporulation protein AA (anti-sigma F factor antagonist)